MTAMPTSWYARFNSELFAAAEGLRTAVWARRDVCKDSEWMRSSTA